MSKFGRLLADILKFLHQNLRDCNTYFSFEMEERGSIAPPKGIPYNSTSIVYTVFISKKQFNKLKVDTEKFHQYRFLIQGEPTLEAPLTDCPGEIGIICMQISELPNKTKEQSKGEEKAAITEQSKEEKQLQRVAVQQENQKEEKNLIKLDPVDTLPEGAIETIPLQDIYVPEPILQTTPRAEKQEKVIRNIQETGTIDQPILIDKKTKCLKDGYSRYYVAKKLKLERVPVCY
ncbi:hypothetical protein [Ectobacillus panaciterrae]|uniref:hypothetical protein n=1 Tax=Ectobacillus panaciterrae TaxID=363872 RepID=UPI000426CE92|nr:hypothetical protein [Ectobacillus panaciterrae]